jgi:hypothetical protein
MVLLVAHRPGAWIRLTTSSDAGTLSVFAQQDDPTVDPPMCEAACDINTCGGATCSAGSLAKRSLNTWDALLDSFGSNDTDANEAYALDVRGLSKRIWRFDAASNTPVGDSVPTVGQVDRYLPAVFKNAEHDYYGNSLPISSNSNERAYSQQVVFGTRPFQIITGGIHGCMVSLLHARCRLFLLTDHCTVQTVTLVSNRAVWMAHFWESYSHRGANDEHPKDEYATDPLFVERILYFIRGDPVGAKPVPGYKPYIQPTTDGGPLNPDLFNDNDDETMLFISAPVAQGERAESKRAKLKYPTRVDAMAKEFKRKIGREPQVFIVPYKRLDYNDPAEKAMRDISNRGMHLFQYDPSSDGNGKRSWRLFNEARYKVHNLP